MLHLVMGTLRSLPNLLILLLIFFFYSFSAIQSDSKTNQIAGYGYDLRSISVDPSGKSLTAELRLIRESSVYGPDIPNLNLFARRVHFFETKDRLRVRITDSDHQRWEVPQHIIPREPPPSHRSMPEDQRVQVDSNKTRGPEKQLVLGLAGSDLVFTLHTTPPFRFTVMRRSTGDILFDSMPTLVFKDRYLEISSALPADRASLYGFGEHTKKSFRLKPNDTLTLWNSDIAAANLDLNLYGSHPFYIDVRSSQPGASGPGELRTACSSSIAMAWT
uniref:Glycoside hydrolase family 31 N-terminal domain-containing protein n=1 Tax=Ananas comosus var. bracteatus TaxID=296719 RepID=A0A6V7PN34_ANACO|nr:unnamed protein product [Ananas comosus var. bracteatus]